MSNGSDALEDFGIHIHEEAGGHELADKVIPFIEEVIAERRNPRSGPRRVAIG
ncbi:MAG TPA: hypothetical protein VFO84_05310 [Dehalococcoidia bacterium]|nr:hypothetical protein [Dehalococcoidia bacterium]